MKLKEYPALITFLETHLTATIAVPLDDKGTLHAASLLYWNNVEPFELYFVTSRNSEKARLLKTHNDIQCAVVIGTEKNTSFTLQMRGKITEVSPDDYTNETEAYYKKRGNRHDDITNDDTCLLKFVPNWARFTDYEKGYKREFLDIS